METLSRPRRVLVIEDDDDVADVTATMLTMLGNHAITAANGETGIRSASEFEPDVVIIDLGLPDLDGCEVACRIRKNLDARPPMLIAVTAYSLPRDFARTAAAGFAFHLVKPTSVHVLEALMNRASGAPA
jgi:two-component system CheB/CheR fusion protein